MGLRRVWWMLGGFFAFGLERWRNLRVSEWDGEHVLEASVWIDWKGSTGDVVSWMRCWFLGDYAQIVRAEFGRLWPTMADMGPP